MPAKLKAFLMAEEVTAHALSSGSARRAALKGSASKAAPKGEKTSRRKKEVA